MVSLIDVGNIMTDLGLLIALILFVYMSIGYRNPDLPRLKSLKFGFSVVTIIWLTPEAAANWLPSYMPFLGYGDVSGNPGLGGPIHLVSMAIFAGYVFFKARVFMRS